MTVSEVEVDNESDDVFDGLSEPDRLGDEVAECDDDRVGVADFNNESVSDGVPETLCVPVAERVSERSSDTVDDRLWLRDTSSEPETVNEGVGVGGGVMVSVTDTVALGEDDQRVTEKSVVFVGERNGVIVLVTVDVKVSEMVKLTPLSLLSLLRVLEGVCEGVCVGGGDTVVVGVEEFVGLTENVTTLIVQDEESLCDTASVADDVGDPD